MLSLSCGSLLGQNLQIDSIRTDSISCSNDTTGCVTVFLSGVDPAVQYDLNLIGSGVGGDLQNFSGTATEHTFCGVASGDYIAVIRSDNPLDFDFEAFRIDANLPLDVTHTENPVSCFGDLTGSIELSVNSGLGPFIVDWNTGFKDTLATPGTSELNNLTTGEYFYSVVDSGSGCTFGDTINFNAVDTIIPSFTVAAGCTGSPTEFTNTSFRASTSGTPTFTWTFTDGLPSSANVEGPNQTVYSSSGNKNVNLTIQTPDCLVSYDSIINIREAPTVDAGTDLTICEGDTAQLNASGGANYQWIPNTEINDVDVANPRVFPSVDRDYIVQTTDPEGCIGFDTVNVSLNALPELVTTNDTSICKGTSLQLNGSGAVSYLWTPNTNIDDNTLNNPTVTPSEDTRYAVEGTDANGCSALDSVLVEVNTSVIITPINDTTICVGDSARLRVIGSDAYTWTPNFNLSSTSGNLVIATPTASTTYKVTGMSLDGCISEDSIRVNVASIPSIDITPNDTICTGENSQITVSGGSAYQWTNSSTLSDASAPDPIASPLNTTTYSVNVSDGTCSADTSVTIFVLNSSLASTSNDTTICSGSSAILSATGGNGYLWNPSETLNRSNTPNPIATPLTTTNYLVQISLNNTCFVEDSVLVTVIDSPEPITIADTSICAGDTVELFTSGGINYNWLPVTGLENPNSAITKAFPTTTTEYVVAVNGGNNCNTLDTVNVTVFPQINGSLISSTNTICFLDSLVLTASGGTSYEWFPSGVIEDQNNAITTAFPTKDTTLSVKIIGDGGCSDSLSTFVRVLQPNSLTSSNDVTICSGDTVQISTTSGLSSYQWIPNQNILDNTVSNPLVFPKFDTDYIVRAGTGGLCPDVDTVTVRVFERPNLRAISDSILCLGDRVALNFVTPGTYTWTPLIEADFTDPQNPVFFPSTDRSYFLDFSDGSCNIQDTFDIRVSTAVLAEIEGDSSICINETLTLNDVNTASNYSWTISGTSVGTNQVLSLNGLTQDTTVTLTTLNADNCPSSDSVLVEVFNFPDLQIPNDTLICGRDTLSLTFPPTNNYSWTPVIDMSGELTSNPEFFPSISRIYNVSIDNGTGCSIEDSILINARAIPDAIITSPAIGCFNDSIQIIGTGGVLRNWVINGTNYSTDTVNLIAKTDLTIQLTTIGLNGCDNTDTANVAVDDSIALSIIGPSEICENQSAYFKTNVLNIDSVNWINPSLTLEASDSVLFTINSDTVIRAEYTNELGCSVSDSLTVIQNNLPVIELTGIDSICKGEITTLTANPSTLTYTWVTNPDLITDTSTANFSGSRSDTLIVLGEDANGCQNSDSIVVFVSEFPDVLIDKTDSICEGDTSIFIGDSRYTYTITGPFVNQLNSTTFEIYPPSSSSLPIEVRNDFNCLTADTLEITVLQKPDLTLEPTLTKCQNQIDTLRANSITGTIFQWSPSNNLEAPDQLVTAITSSDTATYVLTVTDDNNCVSQDSIIVSNIPTPTITISNDTTVCELIPVSLTAAGATNYTWSPLTELITVNGGNATFTSNATNTIKVIGETTGCTDSAEVTITVVPLPIASITVDDSTLCFGQDLNILGNTNSSNNTLGTFSFDNGANFTGDNTQTWTPQTDTTITLIVRSNVGCISLPVTQAITVYSEIGFEVDTLAFPSCTGELGSFDINNITGGTAPYRYNFNSTDTLAVTSTPISFRDLTQGLYTFYLEDTNSCTQEADINFLGELSFDTAHTDISCYGETDGTISLSNFSGGIRPYSLALNERLNYQADSSFSNLTPGNYIVYVRDSSECDVQIGFSITEPDSISSIITNQNDASCSGANTGEINVLILGGSPNFTLNYGANSSITNNSELITGLSAGQGQVFINDSRNCKDTLNYTIQEATPYIANVVQDGFGTCDSENLSAAISTLSGSNGNDIFSLDLGATFLSRNDIDIELSQITSGSYTLIARDTLLGCLDTTNFNIVAFDGLRIDQVTLNITPPSCANNDGELEIRNLQGGNRPLDFEVFNQDFSTSIVPLQLDSTFSQLESGDRGLTIRDDSGCEYNLSFIMPESDSINASADVLGTHCGQDNGEILITVSGGTMPYSIGLQKDNVTSVTSFDSLPANTYTVYYEDNSAIKCSDSLVVVVPDHNARLNVNADSSLCYGKALGSITVNALIGGETSLYTYQYGIGVNGTIEPNLLDSIIPNTITAVDTGYQRLVLVETNKTNDSTCSYFPELIENNVTKDSLYIAQPDSISYVLDITENSAPVDENPNGVLWVHSLRGGQSPYRVSIIDTSDWKNYTPQDSLNTRFEDLIEDVYPVFIQDNKGCLVELDTVLNRTLIAPNIFTPNEDGKNDTFVIDGLPEESLLRIYDRWGALVYMARNYKNDWNGNRQADGTYFYTLKTEEYTIKGWVVIAR